MKGTKMKTETERRIAAWERIWNAMKDIYIRDEMIEQMGDCLSTDDLEMVAHDITAGK